MSLYIPVYRKMKYSESFVIERSLPAKGELIVKKGDKVVPFTKIGRAKVSRESILLPENIVISSDKKKDGSFFYAGEKIGRSLFTKVQAPYNGYLSIEDSRYFFNQEKKDLWLLSGLWGDVDAVIGNVTAQIKTQTVDINFVASTGKRVMGELIVFPNPSELLDIEYLQNFSNNIKDKIIYIGHHIRREVYEKAVELGVGALIGGSIDLSIFQYAKSHPVSVAVTTGFGKFSTPLYIFEFLKTISNRHVFLDGERGILQIPVPLDTRFDAVDNSKSSLRLAKKGLSVLTFDKNHFGLTGEIEDIQNEVIYVRLNKSDEIVETKIPNVLALI